jgi:hypothetical protein
MPAASTDFYISCFIWGPYTFNTRVTDRINFRNTLTQKGITAMQFLGGQTTPEALAQALQKAGWDGPMWIAEIPAQQINVAFPGQAPQTISIPQSRTLVTLAEESINGKDAIVFVSLDVVQGPEMRQDNNGWVPSHKGDFEPAINVVRATNWWQVA